MLNYNHETNALSNVNLPIASFKCTTSVCLFRRNVTRKVELSEKVTIMPIWGKKVRNIITHLFKFFIRLKSRISKDWRAVILCVSQNWRYINDKINVREFVNLLRLLFVDFSKTGVLSNDPGHRAVFAAAYLRLKCATRCACCINVMYNVKYRNLPV